MFGEGARQAMNVFMRIIDPETTNFQSSSPNYGTLLIRAGIRIVIIQKLVSAHSSRSLGRAANLPNQT